MTRAGIRQLVSRLKTLEPDIVVLEASGGLELPLVATLAVEEILTEAVDASWAISGMGRRII